MTVSIQSVAIPQGQVIAIGVEADGSVSHRLDATIGDAVRAVVGDGRERRILVDVSDLTFIDSKTIGVLLGWAKDLSRRGWKMPIVGANSNLLRLFGLVGLDSSFAFFPTVDAAIAAPPPAQPGGA